MFNLKVLEQDFKSTAIALTQFKQVLKNGDEVLNTQFDKGMTISRLLSERAHLVDQILLNAWKVNIKSDVLSLVAVGGYGRSELYPGSDIDLMIIQPFRIKTDIQSEIESFIRFLWDIGLEVGHSVRTVKDCIREAKSDITVVTNIMESRLLVGREDLYSSMKIKTGPNKIWKTRKFFESKHAEQIKRHQRFNDTDHNLEPNIKEGPGGLRDIQMIYWVAMRNFSVEKLEDLVAHNFLTQE
ncbi:MAG: [protein-PII] uridylyltransferase, partial [Gammaproteobacteria bacterium]|nr:[protein-PII] uridylyltransferase [Gammaproteobacteria bacterium]